METIIIGSGLAGYLLAKEFRQLNASAPLRIITQSDGRFYSKPLLSTAFTQKKTADMLSVATAAEMADELQAEINVNTKVATINPSQKILHIANQDGTMTELAYSQLVLACGSVVLNHHMQGEGAAEILSVNDLQDYTLFRKKLLENPAKKMAIIGAGLVGCEFANDLCNAGYSVDVVTLAAQPLERLLPWQLGRAVASSLASIGVQWHFNASVERIDKRDHRYLLHLSSGEVFDADFVLSAIGLRANSQLAQAAGIAMNKGIKVNVYLETNLPSIYALGDCVEVNEQLMFYIAPLRKCVHALARTLTGERTAVVYPAMSVSIKIPVCPTVVSPPPEGLPGEWVVTGEGKDLQALYYDSQGCLRGFALTGTTISARAELTDLLPALF